MVCGGPREFFQAMTGLAGTEGRPRRGNRGITATDRRRRFEALMLPHLDAALSLARWLSRSSADAEDIAQEAYLRAFRLFDGFRGERA